MSKTWKIIPIVNLLLTVFLVVVVMTGGKPVSIGGTTNLDTLELSENLAVTGTSTLSGRVTSSATTTISCSYDGFTARDDFTMSTGTAKMVITNSCGADWLCSADNGVIDWKSSGFSPRLQFALATSTSATGYGTNLMASTTIATTSTDEVLDMTYASPFKVKIGESIVGALSDYNSTGASSTHYGNWAVEAAFGCWLMGG